MRIDADSNGSVEWHEFMNYMLLENQTLNAMKKEHFNYEKSNNDPDPPPSKTNLCHARNITSIVVLYPEDMADSSRQEFLNKKSPEYIKQIKYVTASSDGMVKIWKEGGRFLEQELKVSSYYVMATCFMSYSKRLVAATADRMISFYKIQNGQRFDP
jgi:WD40 repeat protein